MIYRIIFILAALAMIAHSPIALSNGDIAVSDANIYKQYYFRTCTFSGGGVEGEDYKTFTDKNSNQCKRICERRGDKCIGYDRNYMDGDTVRDICRILFKQPDELVMTHSATCWLKNNETGDESSSSDNDQDQNDNEDKTYRFAIGSKSEKTVRTILGGKPWPFYHDGYEVFDKEDTVSVYYDNGKGSIISHKLKPGEYFFKDHPQGHIYLESPNNEDFPEIADSKRGMKIKKKPFMEDNPSEVLDYDSVVWCRNVGAVDDSLADDDAERKLPHAPWFSLEVFYNEKDAYLGKGKMKIFARFENDNGGNFKNPLATIFQINDNKFYTGPGPNNYNYVIDEVKFNLALTEGSRGRVVPYSNRNPKNFVISDLTLHQSKFFINADGKIQKDESYPDEIWSHKFKCENIHPYAKGNAPIAPSEGF